ncbi:MAG: hypothetical protein LH628_03830 [Microcoleus sp. CAN_BIN18]|nr:hypothetical protein [Microcoleus sp. CAN_BIN18]
MFYPLLFEKIGKISSWLIAIGSLADRACGLDGLVERNCDRFECAVRRSIEFEGISDESEVPYNLRSQDRSTTHPRDRFRKTHSKK